MKLIHAFIFAYLFLFLHSCGNSEPKTAFDPIIVDEEKQVIDRFEELTDTLAESIRHIIENKEPEKRYQLNGTELYSSVSLPELYVSRQFQPIWLVHTDSLYLLEEFIEFIEHIEHHGFTPSHYHLDALQAKYRALTVDSASIFDLTSLELLLSDAFFMVSSHLYHGKINPDLLTAEWAIRRNRPELDLPGKLTQMLSSGNIVEFMERFYPPHPGYKYMIETAKHLQSLQLDDFSSNIKLQPKQLSIDLFEDSTHFEALFNKLLFLGYVDTLSKESLVAGVKSLQKEYGLNQDGKIGRNTLLALDQKIEEKLATVYVNMERLRWLPDSLDRKHIIVNIADFTLDYIVEQDTLISMRTIVGRNFRQTPVFNARMTYLVFSPTWTVPPGILRNDVIPAVAKDISYLSKQNMQILNNSGAVIDPKTIDWKKVRAGGSFPYRVRQSPGGHNALGRVKFMFPNKYSVYLHDTPSKELFARDERTFSSGCIRIQKPFELAQLLLQGDERWNDERIREAMFSGREQTVTLKEPVNIYMYYLTSWADAHGNLSFRQDVYNRDKEVMTILKQQKKSKL
jgi:L,D-transpeptidase YcbB